MSDISDLNVRMERIIRKLAFYGTALMSQDDVEEAQAIVAKLPVDVRSMERAVTAAKQRKDGVSA